MFWKKLKIYKNQVSFFFFFEFSIIHFHSFNKQDEQQQDLKEEANKNAFKKLEIHATQNVNVAQESAPSQRYDGK